MSLTAPVLRYRFDNSSSLGEDTGSAGLTLTNNSATVSTDGTYGTVLSLDGTSYLQSSSNVPSGLLGSSARTISVWIKRTATGSTKHVLGYGDLSTNSRIAFYQQNAAIEITYYNPNISQSTTFDSNWCHVAFSYGSSTTKIYKDGSLINTTGNGSAAATTAAPFRVGGGVLAAGFQGYMSDLRVYDFVLSGGQVSSLTSMGPNGLNALSVSGVATHPLTCGASNGSIVLTAIRGSSPYTYAWNTGATTSTLSSLAAGSYSVTVTDNGGQTAFSSFVLANPPGLVFTTTPIALDAQWPAISGAASYRVTYQAAAGTETIAKNEFTGTTARLMGLAASTVYTIRVYSKTDGGQYVLSSFVRDVSTPADAAVNYDKTFFQSSAPGAYKLTDLSGTTLAAVINLIGTIMATGDTVTIKASSGAYVRELSPTVVKLGESVSIASKSSVFLPFTSTGGGSQTANLTLSNTSNVAVTFNDTAGTISVQGQTYTAGDIFVIDGKKVTVLEV